MSGHINPYYRPQGLMSLKINSLIGGDIDFKYMFYGNHMRCQKEPMFKWLVDTRKVLTVNTADKDWALIKNKRRDKSWINDDFSYWASASRYFIIGYAIESCKGNGASLSVNLDKMVEIFSDKDKHKQLIENFVKDFFYSSSVDIYSTKACKNSALVEYKTLESCFENGYRLCSDLYIALDQSRKMGPIGSFMKLTNVCLALGFDELPIWYIQESSDHSLNSQISKDIKLQKPLAVWGFVRKNDSSAMVAQNDPYGMKDGQEAFDQEESSAEVVLSLGGVKKSNTKLPRAKSQKEAKPKLEAKSVENVFFDSALSLDTHKQTSFEEDTEEAEAVVDTTEVIDSVSAIDTGIEDQSKSDEAVDVAQEDEETPPKKINQKSKRLLQMF